MSKKSTLKGELLRNFWLIMGISIFMILLVNLLFITHIFGNKWDWLH